MEIYLSITIDTTPQAGSGGIASFEIPKGTWRFRYVRVYGPRGGSVYDPVQGVYKYVPIAFHGIELYGFVFNA